ncbi:UDP-N-acetylmuramoyl-L-alanyl-D-glutamate synthetase [Thalassospira profundimaris]|uniref:UDP-N-acetylmuramoylalanine--D-glutamate ligase n=1 Tax=Thalassospira profundimaris TaxID=502049 RepID=A0A367X8Y2_9PROT|nr:UDP-N-acetylmuramoyl-L-alanine--D-glutamate ligase [Thalassospira profundimaris]RCK49909.1 UDP-N-acetylmuramoyl-L-alanyl-D-glutamate synthetase [Thalassospira profundimaris]
MIDLSQYRGKTVAVLGLGKSGLASVKALIQSGAIVWAWDDNEDSRHQLDDLNVTPVNLVECDWRVPEMLVISPGIPSTFPTPHPAAEKARRAGKPIVCDVELLCTTVPGTPMLAITGTNGKSTTTALTAHIIAQSGIKTQVGGNLGYPVLGFDALDVDDCYVLELSSYQLDLLNQAAFDASALLNITPDHLDRHGGMTGYIGAKRTIFARQKGPKWAIISIDDDHCAQMATELAREGGHRIVEISVNGPAPHGVYVDDHWLIDDLDNARDPILDLATVTHMPGRHNWQNIAFAYALCRARQVAPRDIIAGIMSFPGLAHRQEQLGTIDGITFVNDSKATNAEATAKALSAYDNIYWILGGKPKEGGIDGLDAFYGRIKKAFLIGSAAEAFAATLNGHVPFEQCGTLDIATRRALETAKADQAERQASSDTASSAPVILLSPACASFDQFKSFEARGDAFRDLFTDLRTTTADIASRTNPEA